MDRQEQVRALIDILLSEMPQYRPQAAPIPAGPEEQRRLLRALMNLRPPLPLGEGFLRLQDALLAREREEKGVVDPASLPVTAADPRLVLWQGDITRLGADVIVNAANSALLGCFCPCHGCIDNAIHSAAGLQLREECHRLMEAQGHDEPTGRAKLTGGYALPARYVLHTVGPIVQGPLTRRHREELAACYRACLDLAGEKGLEQVAFCCISTGEFHFPNQEAARIAVETVTGYLDSQSAVKRVIFNVFKDVDAAVYRALLGPDRPAEG